jgi:spore germination cell wall hydrolase CwlJ-like protein
MIFVSQGGRATRVDYVTVDPDGAGPAGYERPMHVAPGVGLKCLALNIYHEARGEPEKGKVAVGQVVMNRVADARFPDDVCAVVRDGGQRRRHRCQFSWWCDGRSDRPAHRRDWEESRRIATLILSGEADDPTKGALWYHATRVKPAWRKEMRRGPTIGQHIFYHPPS